MATKKLAGGAKRGASETRYRGLHEKNIRHAGAIKFDAGYAGSATRAGANKAGRAIKKAAEHTPRGAATARRKSNAK